MSTSNIIQQQPPFFIIDEETGSIVNIADASSTTTTSKQPSKSATSNQKAIVAASTIFLLAFASTVAWVATANSTTNISKSSSSGNLRNLNEVPLDNDGINSSLSTTQFIYGDVDTIEELGIQVSKGLSVRVIANTNEKVKYANGEESTLRYHEQSDAAGIVSLDDGGYVYVANSEKHGDEGGGVYGLYFNKDGEITEYEALLTGTNYNCGGGLTPWKTWVSCEEDGDDGQCWQIDPIERRAQETKLGGDGGNYESVAVDKRIHDHPVFFTTEDEEDGALRRFIAQQHGWDALNLEGETTFLNILDDTTFEWTTDEKKGRKSAKEYFPNSEGIQVHEGKVYFMAKKIHRLLILDIDNMTYTMENTDLKFYGEGSFDNQPDQNLFGPTRKWIYFTEDGGDSPGVYARHDSDGMYYTLFQGIPGGKYADDETIGIALSPDGRKFYGGFQDAGVILEVTRDDGKPFE